MNLVHIALLPLALLSVYGCYGDTKTSTPAPSTAKDAGEDAGATARDAAKSVPDAEAVSGCTPQNTYAVTNNGASSYKFVLQGSALGENPTLNLMVTTRYCFDVNANGHPFYIKTARTTGASDQLAGVTNNGAEVGRVEFVSSSSPASLFYACAFHGAMSGKVEIIPSAVAR